MKLVKSHQAKYLRNCGSIVHFIEIVEGANNVHRQKINFADAGTFR